MSTKPTTQNNPVLVGAMAWTCAGIIALLPFHALFTTWLGSNFGHMDFFRIWKELLMAVLGVGCIVILAKDKALRSNVLSSRLFQLIGLFVLLGLLRTLYGYSSGTLSINALLYGIIGDFRYFAFFIVVWIVAHKTNLLQRIWPQLVLGPAVIVVMFGLLQQFVLDKNILAHAGYGPLTIPPYQSVDLKPDYVRLQSTLRGPNPLGAYLAFTITACVALYQRVKVWRLALACILLASGVVLFFSYSRSAWMGAVIGVGTLLVIQSKNTKAIKRIVLVGCAALVVGSLLAFALRNNDFVQNSLFHTDENSSSGRSSNTARFQALREGASDVVHHPLGQGLGSAGPASLRGTHPKVAENYYLQIAQEVGVIGLFIYLSIVAMVAVRLYKLRVRGVLAAILFSSLVGISVINLVSHAWMDDTLSMLWWGLAAIALAPVPQKPAQIKNI